MNDFITILAANLLTLCLAVWVAKRMILRWELIKAAKTMEALRMVNANPAKITLTQLESILTIPIIFHENKEVLASWGRKDKNVLFAWNEYADDLRNRLQDHSSLDAHLHDLLREHLEDLIQQKRFDEECALYSDEDQENIKKKVEKELEADCLSSYGSLAGEDNSYSEELHDELLQSIRLARKP